jgi:hypothetical protein
MNMLYNFRLKKVKYGKQNMAYRMDTHQWV